MRSFSRVKRLDMKLVINRCYGGFGLSEEAIQLYAQRKGLTLFREQDGIFTRYSKIPFTELNKLLEEARNDSLTEEQQVAAWDRYNDAVFYDGDIDRADPDLVAVVEELGSEVASDRYANLKVVEIPDGVEYTIEEYDGVETIEEIHRSWF